MTNPSAEKTRTAPDVFANPGGTFDRLVVITDDAIVVANPDSAAMNRVDAAADISTLRSLLASGNTMPFAAITRLSTNKHGDAVNVYYRDATRERYVNIGFKDAATRDAAWDRLRARAGRSFTFSDEQYGAARAALVPLLTLIGCVGLTWLFYGAASELAAGGEADIRGRNAFVKNVAVWLMEWLGPTGLLVAGGLISVGVAFWLVARVRNPPRMLTLTRR